MRLQPDAEAFIACYPDWHRDVAQLIANDKTQATFGIFGRWGSGKSSACAAIRKALVEISTKRERFIGIVELSLSDIQRGAIAERMNAEILDMIGRKKGPKMKKETTRRLASLFGALAGGLFGGILNAKGGVEGEIAAQAGSAAGTAVSTEIENFLDPITQNGDANDLIDGDQIVFIFDDIDRCYPDKAIQLLAMAGEHFHQMEPGINFNAVISCDPEVLARHAVHVFGVSQVEGFEAISKYIHVPLLIPIGPVRAHVDSISRHIPTNVHGRRCVVRAVIECVGIVPVREILSALPQALLWYQKYYALPLPPHYPTNVRETGDEFCVFLFWSIVAVHIPAIVRFMIKDPASVGLLQKLFKGMAHQVDEGHDMVRERFGSSVVESVRLRPDLGRIAKAIGSFSEPEMTRFFSIIGSYS